jgi:hypothetical protein
MKHVLELGGDQIAWRLSLQGANEETHDATTKKKGAFRKMVEGMKLLSDLGQKISINMCVVEHNYRSLLDLPELVRKYNVWQVHLDMVRPRDAGERTVDYLDGLMPNYSDLADVLRTMFIDLEKIDPAFDINIGNLPYCVMPEWGHKIHHEGNFTLTVALSGNNELSEPWNKYEDKSTDKLKLDSCEQCVFEHRCSGFFDLYANRRGVDEFTPVSMKTVRAVDPEHRLFVMRLTTFLKSLGEELLPGWTRFAIDEDELYRRLELELINKDGHRVRFKMLPPDAPGGGDGEHSEFVFRLQSFTAPDHIAYDVAQRFFEVFVQAARGGEVRAPFTLQRARARAQVVGRDSVVPRSIQKRVHRLIQGQVYQPWTLTGSVPVLERNGAIVYFSTKDGDQASMLLAANDEGRTEVSWEFSGSGDDERRRALMRGVAACLQGKPAGQRIAS